MAFRDGKRTCILCGADQGTTIEDTKLAANCLITDEVGDFVHITGDIVADRIQVEKVDVTDRTTMPAIGVIIEKTSDTECVVQTDGDYITTGLTAGTLYYIGNDSKLSADRPTAAIGGIALVQIVGEALDATKLYLDLELDIVEAADSRFALGISFEADCLATDDVGHFVYITGPGAVTKVDIEVASTMPSIGPIVEKISTTRCRVQTIGEYWTAETLVPGTRYWISGISKLQGTPPTPAPASYIMAQVVGVALEENKLILRPDMQAVKLQG